MRLLVGRCLTVAALESASAISGLKEGSEATNISSSRSASMKPVTDGCRANNFISSIPLSIYQCMISIQYTGNAAHCSVCRGTYVLYYFIYSGCCCYYYYYYVICVSYYSNSNF